MSGLYLVIAGVVAAGIVADVALIGYLGGLELRDWLRRRRRNARRRISQHARALARLRRSRRTFATIRATATARARNGTPPTRPLLLIWPTRETPVVRPVPVPQRFLAWPVAWVQPVLDFRGAGPVFEEVRSL